MLLQELNPYRNNIFIQVLVKSKNMLLFLIGNYLVLVDIAIRYDKILNKIIHKHFEEKGVSLVRPMQYSVQQ